MRKALFISLVLAVLAFSAFAQDEAESTTVLDGTLVMVRGSDGQTMTMLKLAGGKLVAVVLPQGEAARLQIRARQRVQVEGVFIGAVSGTKTQARILAHAMAKGGKTFLVENPVRLTEQDRLQIRAYAEEQLKTQAQAKDQLRTSAPAKQGSDSSRDSGGSGGESEASQTGNKQ